MKSMETFINKNRPPVFCPGCSHEKAVHSLDKALINMGLDGSRVVIVSDIGCSGLFDTFFNTHAFHGLHGRALTYAVGIKMAKPRLKVIVTMGDGGIGIGGAHFINTIRKNIDLTLLVLNNFNYGMTGGQASSTTPEDAVLSSSFLNRIEKPIDPCHLAWSAGAGFAARVSSYEGNLAEQIEAAVSFNGFSIVEIMGICTGRYSKRNRITPQMINDMTASMPQFKGRRSSDMESDETGYTEKYFTEARKLKTPETPPVIEKRYDPLFAGRREVVILGGAGQRVVTAGEIVAAAGMFSGLDAALKNDYPITVLRGHSVSEVVLQDRPVNFTGIDTPDVVIAISKEGIERGAHMFRTFSEKTLIVKSSGLAFEGNKPLSGKIVEIDFKKLKIKSGDMALACLAYLAVRGDIIHLDMLKSAVELKFKRKTAIVASSMAIIEKAADHFQREMI